MCAAKKLLSYPGEIICRGQVFRVPGKYPYEEVVDFMLFELIDGVGGYGLMVTSGYKTGLTLIKLPQDCVVSGGISKSWVIDNWAKWIYPDCDVSEVYVLDEYKACD